MIKYACWMIGLGLSVFLIAPDCLLAIEITGTIDTVKLYQNQAKIERVAKITLNKGINTVTFKNLPPLLYDWSVKGGLSEGFRGKIISLEVSKNALTQKRQVRIVQIEDKLTKLRDQDQVFLDDLKNLQSQERFLDSILSFTNQNVSKELMTRIPQIGVWDNTLSYVRSKTREIFRDKRRIESEREQLGKEIQKWEFELSQVAGTNYYRNYQALSKAILLNRATLAIQQFDKVNTEYGEKSRLFERPEGQVDFEKRVEVTVYSPSNAEASITLSYVIPNTQWNMKYDIRANGAGNSISMTVYADVYQMTGEDWSDIDLALSTGQPVNSINPPDLAVWYVDIFHGYKLPSLASRGTAGALNYEMTAAEDASSTIAEKQEREKKDSLPYRIKDQGPNVEVHMPIKQTITSSNRNQKKFIQDFTIASKETDTAKNLRFYYELIPSEFNDSYLKAAMKNTTSLPWLDGEAQIFLENEFMGKVRIPYTPQGKEREVVLGIEKRITSQKDLVKKFEDTAGLFGGRRRILYKYKITVENNFSQAKEATLLDTIPVSRNKGIEVGIENLSTQFAQDDETKKTVNYMRGIRTWQLSLLPNEKREITYDVVITFDKDTQVSGIR